MEFFFFQTPTAESASKRGDMQLDASRRGKKVLDYSRDENEGAYRSGEGGEEPP